MTEKLRDFLRRAIREELETLFSSADNLTKPSVLTTSEAADLLGLQKSTLQAWRTLGKGPDYLKLHGAVRYDRDSLIEWQNSRAVSCK